MAATETVQPKKQYRPNGKRLGSRGVVAKALLEQGVSYRSVQKQTGVSTATLSALKRHELVPREEVDAVKRSLQDKFALIANKALDGITDQKLEIANIQDLIGVASKAFDRSGLATSPIDSLVDALSKYQKKAVSSPKVINASCDNSHPIAEPGSGLDDSVPTT
jgi:hypothetical protein